jgi:hypothetical protein
VTITSFSKAERLLVNPECSRVRRALQADRNKVQAETRVSVEAKKKRRILTLFYKVIFHEAIFIIRP